MTVGLAVGWANAMLDSAFGGAAFTPDAAQWVQLHTGDPGAAGTASIAGNATRKQISWGTATGGVIANDTAIVWTTGEVDTPEDYTHFTIWTASSGGTFRGSGTVTADAVQVGNEFHAQIGSLTQTLDDIAA